MNPILGMLVSRWTLSLLGTALLAGLAWVFGPLLPPLADWPMRLALVLVMLLIWAVANLLLELLRRGRETTLEAGLTAQTAEEATALSDKLGTALRLLKQRQRSRGYLYEQPWYAIIGPPGAGKTTALLNAGLHFPLADEMGKGALSGVGGTRLCEWWFTEEAVLIDTAGRYTTQDSNTAVDRAGWAAFLDLLQRTRPRQPLNGVIVAIALSDIARAPAAERLAHAQAIRQRVRELETRFGMRLPVYALFTKADLIAGFTEFFDDLDEAGRAQVWGTTFAMPAGVAAAHAKVAGASGVGGTSGATADFGAEFRALLERLNLRLYERLLVEPNLDRRSRIAMFPSQFASLERPLLEFLQAAFAGSADGPALLLRGAYHTSGTQEGTPIDRLLGMMARSFGLDQRSVPSLRPDQGRSYFLNKLLREVIFGEAMLVSRNPAAERRRTMVRAVAFAGAALVVLAAGTWLWRIETNERRQIDAADAALAGYEQAAKQLPLSPVADADLPRLVPWLDQASALARDMDAAAAVPPPWWKLGLSQGAKLAAAAHEVYRHALERALLPRLLWRLEAQLRGNMNQPDFLYEATRVYLMLGNAGPLDRNLVHEWMKLDWQTSYPGDAAAPTRDALLRHLDRLLAEPLPAVSLDGGLVVQARSAFSGVSLAQRAYSRVRPSVAAQSLPPWRPIDALGAAGADIFVRASGKPMTDGIPGFLTVEGFHKVLLPSLDTSARSVVSESWVLGQRVELDPNGPQMHALQQQMIALYETDYVSAWDAMLADLNFVQMRSLPRAAQDLYIVESPESPMRALLVSIARQLRLSVPPAGMSVPPAGAATNAPQPLASHPLASPVADSAAAQLQAVIGKPQQPDALPSAPGHEVDERYQALLSFVGNGPGAPIDSVMKSLIDIQQVIAKLAAAPVGSAPPAFAAGSNPAVALQAEATRLPQPVSRWITSIANSGVALLGGSPSGQVAAVFNAPGGPAQACPAAITGHYPFTRDAANDLSLGDFSQLFAPGGLIDGFVNTLLRPYVDMSGTTWHPQTADGVAAPVAAADLAQFQRAASIRDAFFAAGGTTPAIRFDITPVSVDRTTKQATLDIDGTTVTASHEPPRSTQITWPSAAQTPAARLAFDPPLAGQAGALQDTGPWSMFRLFGRGKFRAGSAPDRYTLTFQIGDRQAVFDIRTSSGPSPFTPGLLQDFHCPGVSGK